jgi:hypothetical protein
MNSPSGFETKYVIYLSLAELVKLFSKLNALRLVAVNYCIAWWLYVHHDKESHKNYPHKKFSYYWSLPPIVYVYLMVVQLVHEPCGFRLVSIPSG